jgi:hypothetical protein
VLPFKHRALINIQDWDVFARTLEQVFVHQNPEQNARNKLDVLKAEADWLSGGLC